MKPVLNILTILGLIIFGLIMGVQFDDFLSFGAKFIIAVIFGAILVGLDGLFLHRNPYKNFFVEVTTLDAEDVTALSLATHYSLIRVLDQTGIDTSILRIKEQFTGGRRNEHI